MRAYIAGSHDTVKSRVSFLVEKQLPVNLRLTRIKNGTAHDAITSLRPFEGLTYERCWVPVPGYISVLKSSLLLDTLIFRVGEERSGREVGEEGMGAC